MADHPLRSATDRRLGGPLPHQLTNQTQAHPLPINLWPYQDVSLRRYEVLIPVSRGYPSAKGRLPTRYSPVRRFPLLTSTEVSVKSFSLDLHVLGTPPAFILSQDQTLFVWYQISTFRQSLCRLSLAPIFRFRVSSRDFFSKFLVWNCRFSIKQIVLPIFLCVSQSPEVFRLPLSTDSFTL